jgi:NAD(P)-dependent dehydrogenase (short-subunit alcohol dehydrogenase family)
MTTLSNQHFVLITGAASGVGKSASIYLHNYGFKIIACDLNMAGLRELQATHPDIIIHELDITDEQSAQVLVDTVKQVVGDIGLYGLINNAGILPLGPLELNSMEEINNCFQINVIGQIRMAKAFLPLLRVGNGRIIFTSSVAGIIPSFTIMSTYSAAKHALECVCDLLRVELLPWNIPVIAVEPAPINTPLANNAIRFANYMKDKSTPELYSLYENEIQQVEKWYNKNLFANFIKPETVSIYLARALLSKQPKTRYLICDIKTKFLIIIRKFLPDKLYDKLIRAVIRTA